MVAKGCQYTIVLGFNWYPFEGPGISLLGPIISGIIFQHPPSDRRFGSRGTDDSVNLLRLVDYLRLDSEKQAGAFLERRKQTTEKPRFFQFNHLLKGVYR